MALSATALAALAERIVDDAQGEIAWRRTTPDGGHEEDGHVERRGDEFTFHVRREAAVGWETPVRVADEDLPLLYACIGHEMARRIAPPRPVETSRLFPAKEA